MANHNKKPSTLESVEGIYIIAFFILLTYFNIMLVTISSLKYSDNDKRVFPN